MRSPSDASLAWLTELAEVADRLPHRSRPRQYWSQRNGTAPAPPPPLDLAGTCERFHKLANRLDDDNYFARHLGYDCVDSRDEIGSISGELGERVGKPHLWTSARFTWTVDDLCDAIEVLHDLVARPTVESHHSYADCGWHPDKSSIPSGRRFYTWYVNEILDASVLDLRLADDGEDAGRVVATAPRPLEPLIAEVLGVRDQPGDEVAHAISLFRTRGATRNDQRSAIVALGRVLEGRRPFIKDVLESKDEGILFNLANSYDLRHNDGKQSVAYGDEFLPWIFYYYLATVQLTDDLLARRTPTD